MTVVHWRLRKESVRQYEQRALQSVRQSSDERSLDVVARSSDRGLFSNRWTITASAVVNCSAYQSKDRRRIVEWIVDHEGLGENSKLRRTSTDYP